jgi:putative ABC transport system ATP-binding protein
MEQKYPFLETCQLEKYFFRKDGWIIKALDGIDLSVFSGEFLGIVGRSGSGKTTLLNILGALDKPTSGDVFLEGRNLRDYSNNELALLRRNKIGFVFQTFNLFPTLTARENIELVLVHHEISEAERNSKVLDLMDFLGIVDKVNDFPSQLSVGQQQKVAIARALVKDPVIIVADEPTAEMDPIIAREIMENLVELNRKYKVTLLVASHGTGLYDFCDRTLFLKNGKFVSRKESEY